MSTFFRFAVKLHLTAADDGNKIILHSSGTTGLRRTERLPQQVLDCGSYLYDLSTN